MEGLLWQLQTLWESGFFGSGFFGIVRVALAGLIGALFTFSFSPWVLLPLGIALALLTSPKLLILDEPTNGLDPIGIQELRELIRSFPQQGITVILSSHILSEVEQIADHIGILSAGKLGYENKIDKGTDLEEIFMRIVAANREGQIVRKPSSII